ncbi:hypothetical protein H6G80_30790 [Nostoc sp. FACHB-87]|uniref:hypothetical protein n=1 Tax=Nostocaceae TaxID=1162 RepID=UPI001684E170|nr:MULTISPECIES: hypothetical protein [Nostocaceae]MBD2458441.1 hypothetical protein [Nostoc sp. FACHB-87]MBD2478897.1 hypothetical protein [Anabaena sp. FACHB-83]
MLVQTKVSDLFVDLSPEKQEFLAGGCKYYGRGGYGQGEQPTQGVSPAEESSPEQSSPMIAPQPSARLVVGNIITVTPFAKCLPGQDCYGGQGSQSQD